MFPNARVLGEHEPPTPPSAATRFNLHAPRRLPRATRGNRRGALACVRLAEPGRLLLSSADPWGIFSIKLIMRGEEMLRKVSTIEKEFSNQEKIDSERSPRGRLKPGLCLSRPENYAAFIPTNSYYVVNSSEGGKASCAQSVTNKEDHTAGF
jgi:hypothetical protein